MHRRPALAALLLASLCGRAAAADPRPFTAQEFDRLNREGRPVVVDVTARWCPTCLAQQAVIARLARQPAYRDVTVLTVDFDADKAAVRTLDVRVQSTLIAFRGGRETAYEIADASQDGIERIFRRAAAGPGP